MFWEVLAIIYVCCQFLFVFFHVKNNETMESLKAIRADNRMLREERAQIIRDNYSLGEEVKRLRAILAEVGATE